MSDFFSRYKSLLLLLVFLYTVLFLYFLNTSSCISPPSLRDPSVKHVAKEERSLEAVTGSERLDSGIDEIEKKPEFRFKLNIKPIEINLPELVAQNQPEPEPVAPEVPATEETQEIDDSRGPLTIFDDPVRFTKFIPKKRFLLFATVGERSSKAIGSWLGLDSEDADPAARNFDVVLYYYEPNFPAPVACPGDFCLNREGFKWPSLYHFVITHGIEAEDYQAVFAVDDDISMPLQSINSMFDVFVDYKLKFAQPSYNGDLSDLHYPRIQRWRGNTIVRYTNFVENAAIVIDFDVLIDKLLPVLKRTISGWGVDYCFFKLGEADIHEIGTIHTVKAIHPLAKTVTRVSNRFREAEEDVNRREGESLMEFCGAFLYAPKVFFRVKPGEDRETVIKNQLPYYPRYMAYYNVKSKW